MGHRSLLGKKKEKWQTTGKKNWSFNFSSDIPTKYRVFQSTYGLKQGTSCGLFFDRQDAMSQNSGLFSIQFDKMGELGVAKVESITSQDADTSCTVSHRYICCKWTYMAPSMIYFLIWRWTMQAPSKLRYCVFVVLCLCVAVLCVCCCTVFVCCCTVCVLLYCMCVAVLCLCVAVLCLCVAVLCVCCCTVCV